MEPAITFDDFRADKNYVEDQIAILLNQFQSRWKNKFYIDGMHYKAIDDYSGKREFTEVRLDIKIR